MNASKKILIACHCSAVDIHDKLYVKTSESSRKSVEEFFGKENVYYLDTEPRCKGLEHQYSSWEELPDDTFSIIYLQQCPIYPALRPLKNKTLTHALNEYESMKRIWTQILQHGSRVLKSSGGIVLPIQSSFHPSMAEYLNIPERLQTNTNTTYKKKVAKYYKNALKIILNKIKSIEWDSYIVNAPTYTPDLVSTQSLPLLFSPGKSQYDQYLFLLKQQAKTGGKHKNKTRKQRNK